MPTSSFLKDYTDPYKHIPRWKDVESTWCVCRDNNFRWLAILSSRKRTNCLCVNILLFNERKEYFIYMDVSIYIYIYIYKSNIYIYIYIFNIYIYVYIYIYIYIYINLYKSRCVDRKLVCSFSRNIEPATEMFDF